MHLYSIRLSICVLALLLWDGRTNAMIGDISNWSKLLESQADSEYVIQSKFARAIAGIGDLNGDSILDYAVSMVE